MSGVGCQMLGVMCKDIWIQQGVGVRVSKMQGHPDACPRKILESAQNFNFERGTYKTGTFFIFLAQFEKVFQILYVYIAISAHNSAQNFMKLNSDCAKNHF